MINLGVNSSALLSQIINSLLLSLVIFVPHLEGKDARQNELHWINTIAWACISTLLLPIGLGLYFWLGRNSAIRNTERRSSE